MSGQDWVGGPGGGEELGWKDKYGCPDIYIELIEFSLNGTTRSCHQEYVLKPEEQLHTTQCHWRGSTFCSKPVMRSPPSTCELGLLLSASGWTLSSDPNLPPTCYEHGCASSGPPPPAVEGVLLCGPWPWLLFIALEVSSKIKTVVRFYLDPALGEAPHFCLEGI